MLQAVILLVLLGLATFILRRQYSGALVATPYAHLVYFLFVTYIGGMLLAGQYDLENTYYIALVGFLTVASALLGYALVTVNFGTLGTAVMRYTGYRGERLLADPSLLLSILVLVAITFGVSLVFFNGFPPVLATLFDFIQGRGSLNSLISVRDARFELTKGAYFGGEYRGQGLLREIIQTNCSVISAYFFARLGSRYTSRNIAGVVFAVVFAWIFVGGVGDRAPFLENIVIGASAYGLCRPVKPRAVAAMAISLVMLLLLTSLFSTKSYVLVQKGFAGGSLDLLWMNIERVLVGNSINDARIVELVHSGRWELRNGAVHLRNFITSIPGVQYGRPVAYELFAYYNPYSSRSTFYSGTYLSSTYLDFGLIGSMVAYALCGVASGLTERFMFLKDKVTGLEFVFLPVLSFLVAKMTIYGPNGLLTNLATLGAAFIVVLASAVFLRSLSGAGAPTMLVRS